MSTIPIPKEEWRDNVLIMASSMLGAVEQTSAGDCKCFGIDHMAYQLDARSVAQIRAATQSIMATIRAAKVIRIDEEVQALSAKADAQLQRFMAGLTM